MQTSFAKTRQWSSRWLMISLVLLAALAMTGCTNVSTQPTYIYGERPDSFSYPQAPQLTPLQQLEGYFTDPFHWPHSMDPAT